MQDTREVWARVGTGTVWVEKASLSCLTWCEFTVDLSEMLQDRWIRPSHLGGRILSATTVGADEPELMSLPVVTVEPMTFPPEPFRSPGALIANGSAIS